VTVEGLTVGGVSVGLAGIGTGVKPAVLGEFLLREFFELGWVWVGVSMSF
jgi:hypothetical protein